MVEEILGTYQLKLLLPDLFQGMGAWQDHGAPEALQLCRGWTEGHRETESRKK